MKISELISKLQDVLETTGDNEVLIQAFRPTYMGTFELVETDSVCISSLKDSDKLLFYPGSTSVSLDNLLKRS